MVVFYTALSRKELEKLSRHHDQLAASFLISLIVAGFHHSDLRLANVMEIERRKKGKTEDSINDRTRDSRPPTPINSSVDVLDSPPDDNSARHLFKIIDYGLANFEETFAAGPDVVLEVGKLIQPSFLLLPLR